MTLDELEDKAHAIAIAGGDPQEIGAVLVDLVRMLRDTKEPAGPSSELVQSLITQMKCGITDPRTDTNHPGSLLIGQGWEYHPGDMLGCEWSAPGKSDKLALSFALGLELRKALVELKK